MALDAIQALTFDVFGTVVDWRNSVAREITETCRPHGITLDADQFARDWRALYQPSMQRIRSGEREFVKLDVLHRENLEELLPRYGLEVLSEAERNHLNRAWHRLDPWPDVVEGLNRLKRRYILATLSNGNIAIMVNMARRAGLPWDAVLGSEVARGFKPQPHVYRTAAECLGVETSNCLMVAAHNGDLVAAAETGMRTAFVARPMEYGVDQSVDFEAEHEFDVDCKSFIELADALGC